MDDLISEFIAETSESLELLDSELVELEQNPNDQEILGNIFRLVHTIKGTCGFLGLPRLASVAHAGENVLGKIRDGEIAVTPEAISIILTSLDTIKELIEHLSEHGAEPEGDDTELINQLNAFAEAGGPPIAASNDSAEQEAPADASPAPDEEPVEGGGNFSKDELDALEAAFANAESSAVPEVPSEFLSEDDNTDIASQNTSDEASAPASEQNIAPKQQTAPTVDADAKATAIKQGMDAPAVKKEGGAAQQSIRVNIDVLEDLMQMVGELVLTRNQLLQLTRDKEEREIAAPLQQLSQITSELQEGIMKTRMQPISMAWSKFPRLIRDLSHELSKKINLEMIGETTEVDRQLLEAIKDPLTHMVRNSCDHGLETPDERVAAGKPEAGTVTLSAMHEGGHIIIEITDDGRGINLEKVTQKIIDNGLATQELLDGMSDEQIMQFIFKPGFSTAEQVTSVSGRGVGMDVVRTNIEKIGGAVSLSSKPGAGSTFHIKIPLTLAIVSVLIVQSQDQRFAIPQLNVAELVNLNNKSEYQIETVHGASLLRLREKLLPMLSLSELLKLTDGDTIRPPVLPAPTLLPVDQTDTQATGEHSAEDTDKDAADTPAENAPLSLSDTEEDQQYAAIIKIGSSEFGVIVDKVHDTEEIVVKPISRVLDNLEIYAGNTILGDGSVIMILDPNGLAKSIDANEAAPSAGKKAEEVPTERSTTYLLFTTNDATQKAVPLELISRLEEIDSTKVEKTGNTSVIQYRDDLMPLRMLDETEELPTQGMLTVIVFSYDNQSVGLVVNKITDIVKAPTDIKVTNDNPLYLGGLIIAGKTTDVLDVSQLIQAHIGEGGAGADVGVDTSSIKDLHVLFVEDSPFFRNMTLSYFNSLGMSTTAAASGVEALQVLQNTQKSFDVIITDIEMPQIDGFEFAKQARLIDHYRDIPIFAFTSTINQDTIDHAQECNMLAVVNKTNRNELIHALTKHLSLQEAPV